MKIAIVGTRGIPNNYGGFEQLAEYLSVGLVKKGHQVYVYSPHNHIYKEPSWKGVHILHQYDPEYKLGTAGQFIYDFNCILDCRKRDFDIILQLGYTSSSVWSKLFPKKSIIITNMDGLEWKRTKFPKPVQKFVKYAERMAVAGSDYFIADSIGIQNYLKRAYNKNSTYIAYGAHLFYNSSETVLSEFGLEPYKYNMLIARLEPENSIELILSGLINSATDLPFLIIGNYESKYGAYLRNKFSDPRLRFLGAIYDIEKLNNLRHYSNLYFHGHTVGGTNPSLLEAMASDCLICANNNEFNSAILGSDAYYFSDSPGVTALLDTIRKDEQELQKINNNRAKILNQFSWDKIIDAYESCFKKCLAKMSSNQYAAS